MRRREPASKRNEIGKRGGGGYSGGSLRNGQFSSRERSIHRSKKTLNSTSCLVHSLITHARSRPGHPWLNWLPESGRVKREHVEGRRKLAEGTVNRRRESFSRVGRKHALTRERAESSRAEPVDPWMAGGKRKDTIRVIVIFSDSRIAMIHSKIPYNRTDDRQSRYPAVCSYRGLITASAFRELYLTRVYTSLSLVHKVRRNNIFPPGLYSRYISS